MQVLDLPGDMRQQVLGIQQHKTGREDRAIEMCYQGQHGSKRNKEINSSEAS